MKFYANVQFNISANIKIRSNKNKYRPPTCIKHALFTVNASVCCAEPLYYNNISQFYVIALNAHPHAHNWLIQPAHCDFAIDSTYIYSNTVYYIKCCHFSLRASNLNQFTYEIGGFRSACVNISHIVNMKCRNRIVMKVMLITDKWIRTCSPFRSFKKAQAANNAEILKPVHVFWFV